MKGKRSDKGESNEEGNKRRNEIGTPSVKRRGRCESRESLRIAARSVTLFRLSIDFEGHFSCVAMREGGRGRASGGEEEENEDENEKTKEEET